MSGTKWGMTGIVVCRTKGYGEQGETGMSRHMGVTVGLLGSTVAVLVSALAAFGTESYVFDSKLSLTGGLQ
jgi:hypothetical protein